MIKNKKYTEEIYGLALSGSIRYITRVMIENKSQEHTLLSSYVPVTNTILLAMCHDEGGWVVILRRSKTLGT